MERLTPQSSSFLQPAGFPQENYMPNCQIVPHVSPLFVPSPWPYDRRPLRLFLAVQLPNQRWCRRASATVAARQIAPLSGYCLVVWEEFHDFSIQFPLGISSQLTIFHIFQRGRYTPPTRYLCNFLDFFSNPHGLFCQSWPMLRRPTRSMAMFILIFSCFPELQTPPAIFDN